MSDFSLITKVNSTSRDNSLCSSRRCARSDSERERLNLLLCILRVTWALSWPTSNRWRNLTTRLRLCFMLLETSETAASGMTKRTWCKWCRWSSRTMLGQNLIARVLFWYQGHAGSMVDLEILSFKTTMITWYLQLIRLFKICTANMWRSKWRLLSPFRHFWTIRSFKISLGQVLETFSRYSSK